MSLIKQIVYSSIFWLTSMAHAEPLMIDKASGSVEIQDPKTGQRMAPRNKFLLLDHQTLVLAYDASVIIFFADKASKINGPKAITTSYQPPLQKISKNNSKKSWKRNSTGSITSHLSYKGTPEKNQKKTSTGIIDLADSIPTTSKTKSTAKQQSTIVHPVNGRPIMRLGSVEVECLQCTQVKYKILKLPNRDTVYQYDAPPSKAYTGPELGAGNYVIVHHDEQIYFSIINADMAKKIKQKMRNRKTIIKNLDPVSQIASNAKILYEEGLWSEAFYLVKDAHLKSPENADLKQLHLEYYNISSGQK